MGPWVQSTVWQEKESKEQRGRERKVGGKERKEKEKETKGVRNEEKAGRTNTADTMLTLKFSRKMHLTARGFQGKPIPGNLGISLCLQLFLESALMRDGCFGPPNFNKQKGLQPNLPQHQPPYVPLTSSTSFPPTSRGQRKFHFSFRLKWPALFV